MRTNIVIDDRLMSAAMKASGAKTKRETVELGLQTLVRFRRQSEALKYFGRLPWEGDLDAMRTD